MLALIAAITVAIGVHPPHAEAASTHHHGMDHQAAGSHGHFGAACLQTELDEVVDRGKSAVPPGHADCTQVFDPLQRPALLVAPIYSVVADAAPHDLPFRQLITSFDPPPPRRS